MGKHKKKLLTQRSGPAPPPDIEPPVKKARTYETADYAPRLTTIDIESYAIQEKTVALKEELMKFKFSNGEYFHPDNNTSEVAKKCFGWIFNPIGFDKFVDSYQNKKIVILKRGGAPLQ